MLWSRSAEVNRDSKAQRLLQGFHSLAEDGMREDETQFWREHFRAGGKQVMLLRPRQIWIPEAGVIVGMSV